MTLANMKTVGATRHADTVDRSIELHELLDGDDRLSEFSIDEVES